MKFLISMYFFYTDGLFFNIFVDEREKKYPQSVEFNFA